MNFFKKRFRDQSEKNDSSSQPPRQQPVPYQPKSQYQSRSNNSGTYTPPAAPRLSPQKLPPQDFLSMGYFFQQPEQRHGSIMNGGCATSPLPPTPDPAASSAMPLGEGQGHSRRYSLRDLPVPVCSNGNGNEGFTTNNSIYRSNNKGATSINGDTPPLTLASGGDSNLQQTLLPTQPQFYPAFFSSSTNTSSSASTTDSFLLTKYREPRVYPVVVGIDFGMKYTTVAYSVRTDSKVDEIFQVNNWPRDSTHSEWTPTISAYKNGSKEIADWGFKARQEMNGLKAKDHYLLANVKLQLDDRYIVRPLPNGLTVQEAIADYLRMLNEHIVWDIQRTCSVAGKHTHEDYQYWLTVPGHWSDRAKQTMRQAAIEAGLVQPTDPPHRLMLASDEMAMAVYSARKACQLDLRDGDRFMICHAPEGESVTLVVYEVGMAAGRACEMKEVASSFSPLCGPDFLDANMERLLERRLRKYRDIIPARGWQNFMYYFNHTIRKQFDGAEDQHLQLPTLKGLNTDDEEAGINGGYMVLTAAELREDVFEPVVTDVLELIRDVLLRSGGDCMRALFVLGEFGSTRYMWKRMREEFEHQVGMIYSPLSPELAIARGAVCLGLGLYFQEETS